MKRACTKLLSLLLLQCTISISWAQTENDSIRTLNEAVVTGTRDKADIRHLPMTISVIDNQQIRDRHEQSLIPVINEQVPGLFITSRGILGYGVSGGGSGGMKIRGVGGGPTTGVLILIDGHPQYMGLMGHPVADSYQTMLADKVEVVRGPASVLYGSNAMGGVINIVTPELAKNGSSTSIRLGYGSYNTVMNEVVNQYRKGRFHNIVSASYNRSDGHRDNMEFGQFSGYTKLGYDFSKTWKAFADVTVTHFNASNPGSITTLLEDNDSRITRGMASLSVENSYEKTSGALKFFYNWGRHNINDGYALGGTPRNYLFNSKDLMLGATLYQSVTLFKGNRLTAGVDYQHFGGKAWNDFTDNSRTELVDKTENEIAGYIAMRQNLGKIVTIDAGIRLDYHSQTGAEWIPQGGIALQLPHSSEIRAMVSRGFRNPTIREMYMFPPQNPDLRPESMMSYELSYAQRLLNKSISYSINLFYITGKNMIQTMPVEGRPLNINTAKIENLGVEAMVSYKINAAWSLSTNYSWLLMKYPVIAAPEHKLYAGVNFTKGKWNASTGVQYINGLYTEITPTSEIKENFVLWNARVGYKIHPIVTLFLKGENLLAQRYEINAGYPMPRLTVMGGININF